MKLKLIAYLIIALVFVMSSYFFKDIVILPETSGQLMGLGALILGYFVSKLLTQPKKA